jgi:hypothetical protein
VRAVGTRGLKDVLCVRHWPFREVYMTAGKKVDNLVSCLQVEWRTAAFPHNNVERSIRLDRTISVNNYLLVPGH